MIVFRWIMSVLGGLLAAGALLSFVVFVTMDLPLWLVRARNLRRGVYTVALFWFNVEVWGRVVWTLLHWNR